MYVFKRAKMTTVYGSKDSTGWRLWGVMHDFDGNKPLGFAIEFL